MMKRNRKDRRYTLVEIMMVLIVILILVTIGILVAPLITRQASAAKTKALMGMIENAIEEYKGSALSGGNYPMSPLTCGKGTQYTPFFLDNYDERDNGEDSTNNPKNNMMQFFDIAQIENQRTYSEDGKRFCVIDGFGMPFLYMAPGYRMSGGYDLVSLGANLVPGTGKNMSTPSDRLLKGFLSIDDANEAKAAAELGVGDDIANFTTR